MNDEQLLARAKQFDPEALRELHLRFYEPVVRYIVFKVGNLQTGEDLCGEVFVRVLAGLKRGQVWRDSPQGWIMGIARHVVVDYYRWRERNTEIRLGEWLAASDENSPTQQAIVNERKRDLMDAIQMLPDQQRDVILMRFIEGIDIRSVAKALSKSPGAVKGLQYRAMKALAELLQTHRQEAID